jgi:predicted kinase
MAKMIIMQGLPASGKSTKAEEIMQKDGGCVRINKDLLRTMLHFNKWSGKNEGLTRDAARALANHFLASGVNVIIDDTNLNEGTVQSWKDLAKLHDAKIEYVRMETPVEECVVRDSAREKKVGRSVIEQMALQHTGWLKGQKVIVCDLDGTLCDISHRLPFVKVPEGEKKDWKSFFAGIKNDKLREDVKLQVLGKCAELGLPLVLVSARPDTYRGATEQWLFENLQYPYLTLIMRRADDKRPDTDVKKGIYETYFKNNPVELVFDDRPSVIRMWRELGLNVVDVGSGVEF